jgi:hypothetical protein
MTWVEWFIVGYFALNALCAIGLIGKERQPITPSNAVAMTVIYTALVSVVVIFG